MAAYNTSSHSNRPPGGPGQKVIMENNLDVRKDVVAILDEVLGLKGRAAKFRDDSPLLGAVPELDSMAVVALINSLEERFGFSVEDDEIDGSTFATMGSLVVFVESKLG